MGLTEQREFGFVAPLERYGLVQVSGEDAVTFIHDQFSHDIAGLKADEARYAGYCTPEGRLLGLMLVWKSASNVWLMMPHDILPALVKRLQIYILRAKVKMTDVSDTFVICGLGGKMAPDVLQPAFSILPDAIGDKAESEAGTLIRIRDAFGSARFLWIALARKAGEILPSFLTAIPSATDEDWELGDIAAALPQIYATTQNRFIPQMMNLELVDALSFTKGCYPGQEIVARTQYRGTLKRRMMLAYAGIPGGGTAADAGISPGLDIFDTAAPDEPCGMLVRAARYDANQINCLIVIPQALPDTTSLRVGAPDGSPLHLLPLPYALPDQAG